MSQFSGKEGITWVTRFSNKILRSIKMSYDWKINKLISLFDTLVGIKFLSHTKIVRVKVIEKDG